MAPHAAGLLPLKTPAVAPYECKVRTATLGIAVKRANANLAARDLPPLPAGLTPHSLRRTFASVLFALGEPPPLAPPAVIVEIGSTSHALALRVHAQAMRIERAERDEPALPADGEKGHGGPVAYFRPVESARGPAA